MALTFYIFKNPWDLLYTYKYLFKNGDFFWAPKISLGGLDQKAQNFTKISKVETFLSDKMHLKRVQENSRTTEIFHI
jgi:hypothetical protein